MSKSKIITPLKPIEPSQLWTFENALSLLKTCKDKYILQALDEFLLNNKDIFLNPLPFSAGASDTKSTSGDVLKDLSLRNVLYSDISPSNNADARIVSELLNVDFKEALRTVSQTCQRIPERKPLSINNKLKSKLSDDSGKRLQEERIITYSTRLLRDRRVVLEIVIELLNNKLNPAKSLTVQNLGREIVLSTTYINSLLADIKAVNKLIVEGGYKSSKLVELEQLNTVIYNELILTITELLKVTVEVFQLSQDIPFLVYRTWFQFMEETRFMLSMGPAVAHLEPFQLIQALSTIASLVLLEIDDNYGKKLFMLDLKTLYAINGAITKSGNINTVIMYSWSIILYRKIALGEADQVDNLGLHDIINSLNARCSSVFTDISNLNNLLRFDNLYSAILSKVLILAVPLANINNQIASTIQSVLEDCPPLVIESFYQDEGIIKAFILARAKFPIQIIPYLMLSSISGIFAIDEFNTLKSYMSSFDKAKFDQINQIDDENTELVKLTEDIDVFPPYEINKKLSLFLSTNTKAKVLPSSKDEEVLVTFLYKYNGWAFLGRILQNIVRSSVTLNDELENKSEFVINLVKLLTRVVNDNSATNSDQVLVVLDSMSAYIDDSDVIEILFRLFEQNLHTRKTNILISLLNLFTSLVPLIGIKIWSYIGKSALLSTNTSKEGFASTIFGAVEMINGDYEFSISLIKLANELAQDCLAESVVSFSDSALVTSNNASISRSKHALLGKFVDHLISIFESFPHCRFNKAYQKMEIGCLLINIFQSVLTNIYTIDEGEKPSSKVTHIFAESAEFILNSFLTAEGQPSRSCYPILAMIDTLLDHQHFNLYESRDLSGYWFKKWVKSSLSFSQLLISIRGHASLSVISNFEREIFIKLPSLVEVYSLHQNLRKDILDLITSLTYASASGISEANPPSLLSHLGRNHSQILLRSLICDLKNTFDDYEMKVSLYDFICSVLSGNQEGLSMLFISGRDVYGEIETSNTTDASSAGGAKESILTVLKKNLRDLKYYPKYVSLHLVDAIALAFNSWTTIRGNEDDLEFVDLLLSMFNQPQDIKAYTTDEYISRCYELKLLSKITEILSLIIYTTKNVTLNKKLIEFFIQNEDFKFEFLKRFDTLGYNQTLHEELEKSFSKNLHMDIYKFSSSLVKRNRFGLSAVYNLNLMDKMFGNTSDVWTSLREHVIACNVNIQYLNAQISVVKSHGALLTAFCRRFGSSLNADWVFLASQLLFFNVLVKIPSEMFEQVYRERIELSFFILYTMSINNTTSRSPPLPENLLDVVKFVSELIQMKKGDDEGAGGSSYKSLLRILKLALGMINGKENKELISSNINLFIKLFNLIISNGTSNLLITIQNDAYLIRTTKYVPKNLDKKYESLSIILSIISEFVTISESSPTSMSLEMTKIVNSNGTIKALMNLFTCLKVIKTMGNNDEEQFLFAQLSLMIIFDLLRIKSIAQEFINAGLFMVLTTSSIPMVIQRGSLSITDKSNAKYYTIWCNGLLPLVLSIFKNLGPQVLPEVCMFLKSYKAQIATCTGRWFQDLSSIEITTASISETRQILYIYQMLKYANVEEFLTSIGVAPTYTDEDEMVNMLLIPGLESKGNCNEFVDSLNNLLKHPKFVSSRVLPSSPEEKRLIDADPSKFSKDLINDIRDLKEFLADQDE